MAGFAPAGCGSTAPSVNGRNGESSMSETPGHSSRRSFLFKLAVWINGAVGAVLAVPVFGYLLGPALKRKTDSYHAWIALGTIDAFPEGKTRLVNFQNPVTTAADGLTAKTPCWVRHISG